MPYIQSHFSSSHILQIPINIPSFWLPTLQFWTQTHVQTWTQNKSLWLACPSPPLFWSIRVFLAACSGMVLISQWIGFLLHINRSSCIFVVGDNHGFINTGNPYSTKNCVVFLLNLMMSSCTQNNLPLCLGLSSIFLIQMHSPIWSNWLSDITTTIKVKFKKTFLSFIENKSRMVYPGWR